MTNPRLRELIVKLAPVYPGESAVVSLCLGVNFLVVAGIMFGRNARDSLFLVYFGVQYLPVMYFANAAFLIICSVAYTSLVDRMDRGKFLGGLSILFVAALIISRVILVGRPHWFFPVLYIEAQVIWNFSLMQFWTFVGDLFDTRQAKRLYPLLAVGALLGMIGVGLGSRIIVHALGTENLFLVWAGLILAAVILGGVTYRKHPIKAEPPRIDATTLASRVKPSEWQKIKEGLEEVGREPLLRSMAGYVLLMWTVYAIVDFCFNKTMRARYPDPNDLTTFFGMFIGVQGLTCLLVQVFLTRPVIARLGIGKTINFHPCFLLCGTAWMSVAYGYPSVLTTKLGDASMLYTFSDSSYQLLYNPVPLDRRARVRGFIEGYIRPLSLAAAGVLVLLGNNYLKPLHVLGREISSGQQLSWGAVVLASVWLGFALSANKGYIRALLRNLRGDSPTLRQAAAKALGKMKDSASLAILAQSLHSENPDRVITSIQFLESLGGQENAASIAALLDHPNARVRATAVGALTRLDSAPFAEQLTQLLADPDARVRANAIEGLASAGDRELPKKMRPLVNDPSTRARVNVMLTIAGIQGISAAEDWFPMVRKLAQGNRNERATATFALGRLPADQSMDLLSALLKDPELEIRCEAARALGRIGSARVIPALVEALAGPAELRHYTRHALARIAKRVDGNVSGELGRMALASERPEIRSELAAVLGRLNAPQNIETLIRLLKDPEWRVRWKVLKSFGRVSRAGPLPESARIALFDYAGDELANFRRSLLDSESLVPQPRSASEILLAEALQEDRDNIEERVFRMLGILCGRQQMHAIFEKLRSGDARLRADALEALDNLAPKKIGREVLGLIEPEPARKNPAPSPDNGRIVAALARHPKPWVRACAAYYAGDHPQSRSAGLLRDLVQDHDRVVRETALYAGWQAFRNEWRPQLEGAAQSADAVLSEKARKMLVADAQNRATLAPERGVPMLLTVEKVLALKSAPVFAALEGEELAALSEIALEREFPPGEIIFEEGQPPHHLYILIEGKVEVFRRVDSTERPLAILGEKECFGEMAILDDEPRSASVRAIDPTRVLKIDRESFRELILDRPQIAFAIFKILSSRLRHKNLEADSLPLYDSSRSMA